MFVIMLTYRWETGRGFMEYNYLRYITKIVEMGSMSKAANSLFMSQSTLSKSINLMEKQIGYKIFERNNRGVQLTC